MIQIDVLNIKAERFGIGLRLEKVINFVKFNSTH